MSLSSDLSKSKLDSPIKSVTVDINATLASLLLEKYNDTNRKMRKGSAILYSSEMLRGKWKLNGEPLIFGVDEAGKESIISAQHRLYGLVLAQKAYDANPDAYPDATLELHTVVIYGVSLETADSVDIGINRVHKDVLFRDAWTKTVIPAEWSINASRMNKWASVLAGAARLVWLRAGGATVSSAPKFLISEMLDFLKNEHSSLCRFVSSVLSSSEEEGKGLRMSIPYIAALSYVACLKEDGTVDKKLEHEVMDWVLRISQGTGYEVGSSEHALSSYWNQLSAQSGSKDRDIDYVGPFVKALRAFIVGEKITAAKLKLTKKEADSYVTQPILFDKWDTASFVNAVETRQSQLDEFEAMRAEIVAEKEEAKVAKAEAKEAANAEKIAAYDAERLEKVAAREAEKADKTAEKNAERITKASVQAAAIVAKAEAATVAAKGRVNAAILAAKETVARATAPPISAKAMVANKPQPTKAAVKPPHPIKRKPVSV